MPPDLPPGRVMPLPGRGEVFVRDFGGSPGDPAVLLLHGWTASADINFWPAYAGLAESYRVIALDQRGHGRGLRSTEPFRLEDCADDAAALLEQLGVGRVIVVGYSMGGPVGLLLARRHPGTVAGLVLQATALEFRHSPRERAVWRLLPVMDVGLRAGVSVGFFDRVIREAAGEDPGIGGYRSWLAAEFQRATASDLVAAGRALSRYDARPWAGQLGIPAAVLATTRDRLVRLAKQVELAEALRAQVFAIDADHRPAAGEPRRVRAPDPAAGGPGGGGKRARAGQRRPGRNAGRCHVTRYDVSNSAVIAATPSEIIGAFLEEAAGRSQWWQPYLRMRQRGGRPLPEIGAAVDIAVAGEGRLDQGWSTRIAGRVAAFEPDRRLVLEYFEGDFRGTEEWTVDAGRPRPHAGHHALADRPAGRGAAGGQVRRRAGQLLEGHARGLPRDRALYRQQKGAVRGLGRPPSRALGYPRPGAGSPPATPARATRGCCRTGTRSAPRTAASRRRGAP